MTGRCPAILIAGTSSGVGKTSLSLGIVRSLARRGLRVQTFKVGPDFLDPSYLALASGRPCYNLDGWMTGREYVQQLFARVTADADIAVVEGVMGLFDGASPTSLEGSSAEIAQWLDLPVLLVTDVHGAARSLAATVKGFAEFEPVLRLAGVIANQTGSERHGQCLGESLSAAGLPALVGAVPSGALPALHSRHLGLVTASKDALPEETIDELGNACQKHLNLGAICRLAGEGHARKAQAYHEADISPQSGPKVLIGIARDEAFHFYYVDNLEILRSFGAELVDFSPLKDRRVPPGLGGIYLGGGYPELYARRLAANGSMIEDVRRHVALGKALYAECGGLMYLGQTLTTLEGNRFAMVGVLPVETTMLGKLKSLGYVEAMASAGTIWGGTGPAPKTFLRGHEFHYSDIVSDLSAADGWQRAYQIRRRAEGAAAEGFFKGSVLASYVHVHFASCPWAAGRFVELCRASAFGEAV